MKTKPVGSLILLVIFFALMYKLFQDSMASAKKVKESILQDVYAEVISINANITQLSNDKFRQPESCNEVLFKLLNTDNYFVVNSCAEKYHSNLDVSGNWTYMHRVGDTCSFEILNKKRLFKMKKDSIQ